jgi:single-stranded-DNA-specific exonuclease
LTLATRNVKIKSIATLGKTKEHLRLTVEDETGKTQSILWWSGAGEERPEDGSTFDIAYSLRASTFRGEKQVTLQFEEFRVTEEKPIEVKPSKLEVIDLRLESASLLAKLQEHTLSGTRAPAIQIWAEGADKAKGKSRFELGQADEFAIYTTPPSLADLRAALEIVKPKKVYVFGVSPSTQKTDEFLSKLAGMVKYVINNKNGKTSARELASAIAQRESLVRIGLEWLAAGGHVSVVSEEEALILSTGNGEGNEYVRKELYVAVKGILEETAAYRAHFAKADVNNLIGLTVSE